MKSEQIADLAAALAKAQGQLTHAIKDATNPHLKSKYADLASVWEACRLPLSENGLSIVQLPNGMEDNCLILETTLFHSSGQWVSSRVKMPMQKQDPQGYGSALTYARRYALAAIVGVYQDDDDAESTKQAPAQQRQPQKQMITELQRKKLFATAQEKGVTADDMKAVIKWKYNHDSSKELTAQQASEMIDKLEEIWTKYVEVQSGGKE